MFARFCSLKLAARVVKVRQAKVMLMRKIVEEETYEEKLDERKNEIEARGKSLEISLYIRRMETQLAYNIKMKSDFRQD